MNRFEPSVHSVPDIANRTDRTEPCLNRTVNSSGIDYLCAIDRAYSQIFIIFRPSKRIWLIWIVDYYRMNSDCWLLSYNALHSMHIGTWLLYYDRITLTLKEFDFELSIFYWLGLFDCTAFALKEFGLIFLSCQLRNRYCITCVQDFILMALLTLKNINRPHLTICPS